MAKITEERWNEMDATERRKVARTTFSNGIARRIGLGLEDLPDTCEIQIENWWDEEMTLLETKAVLSTAISDVCSSIEEDGIGSEYF